MIWSMIPFLVRSCRKEKNQLHEFRTVALFVVKSKEDIFPHAHNKHVHQNCFTWESSTLLEQSTARGNYTRCTRLDTKRRCTYVKCLNMQDFTCTLVDHICPRRGKDEARPDMKCTDTWIHEQTVSPVHFCTYIHLRKRQHPQQTQREHGCWHMLHVL